MPAIARRPVPRPYQFGWGSGQVVEEASTAGEYHESAVQLLEAEDGSCRVRFCYYSPKGQFQRGPLLVGEGDLAGLRAALADTPRLRALLRRLVED